MANRPHANHHHFRPAGQNQLIRHLDLLFWPMLAYSVVRCALFKSSSKIGVAYGCTLRKGPTILADGATGEKDWLKKSNTFIQSRLYFKPN